MFIPAINENKCTNCRKCAKICPKGVFEDEKETVSVEDPFYCTGCDACSAICPEKAIRVEEV